MRRISSGLGEDRDRVAGALAHLAHAIGSEHDRRIGEDRLRLGEDRRIAAVEGAHDLAAELEMRRLVLADGDARRLVDDDVGGLEDGVVEQAEAVFLAVLLRLLVRRVALRPRDRHAGVEDPRQLRVLWDVGLADQRRALGVDPNGEQVEDHLVRQPTEERPVVDGGERMKVDDGVDRVIPILERHVVHLRPEVVAEVRRARWLDAGEDPLAGGRHPATVVSSAVCVM